MDPKVRLGKNVRRLRTAMDVSQERFAHDSGLDRTYVSGIERGVRNPTVMVLGRLAVALKVDLHELLLPIPEDAS
jgi:transcriptional regulator with XRE-family HTH domain